MVVWSLLRSGRALYNLATLLSFYWIATAVNVRWPVWISYVLYSFLYVYKLFSLNLKLPDLIDDGWLNRRFYSPDSCIFTGMTGELFEGDELTLWLFTMKLLALEVFLVTDPESIMLALPLCGWVRMWNFVCKILRSNKCLSLNFTYTFDFCFGDYVPLLRADF